MTIPTNMGLNILMQLLPCVHFDMIYYMIWYIWERLLLDKAYTWVKIPQSRQNHKYKDDYYTQYQLHWQQWTEYN